MSAPTVAAPLAAELAAKEVEIRSSIPPEAVKAIDTTAASLSRFTPNPVAVGSTAPSFELQNATGKTVSLASLLEANSAVVLTYYRGSWCPYCNIALRALTQALPQFEALGAALVALTPELPDETLTTKEKNDLSFEVLSDSGLSVADKFGLAFEFSDEDAEAYKSLGIDLTTKNGNDGGRRVRLPVPATFVLDKTGKVVYSFVNMDYTKRAEPDDIIKALKSIQA